LLGFTEGELLDATIDGLAAGDAGAVFRQIDKVIETGHDPRRFVEDLLERLRDLIVVAAVPDGASSVLRGIPEDQLERMRQQSAAFGAGALSRSADIVNAGLTEMTGATAPRLQLELICARVLLPGASGESGYAARLDRLERRLEIGGASPPAASRSAPPVSAPPTQHQVAAPEVTTPEVTTPEVTPAPAPEAPTAPVPTAPAKVAGVPSAPVREPERPRDVVASPPAEAPRSAMPGGIDTDAIRRSWPDVLAKIFSIRRTTWTFLSEHTQVLDYDGKRLLLGIQTEGLATTFRRGQHSELVRQALSEVLGVEAVVEGISTPESARPAPASPDPAPATPDPVPDAPQAQVSPETATSGTRAAQSDAPAAPDRFSTPMQRARAAVAQEASTRQASSSSIADDSVVSPDDEDIEEAGAVGQPVIARVLGGTVIGELDQ
jgi:DNA polymerase-3 subunit gamma/tau